MSVWSKAKGLFNKVWSGVKKGASAVGSFIRDKALPIYDKIKPALTAGLNAIAPGAGSAVAAGAELARDVVNKDTQALMNRIKNRGLSL